MLPDPGQARRKGHDQGFQARAEKGAHRIVLNRGIIGTSLSNDRESEGSPPVRAVMFPRLKTPSQASQEIVIVRIRPGTGTAASVSSPEQYGRSGHEPIAASRDVRTGPLAAAMTR